MTLEQEDECTTSQTNRTILLPSSSREIAIPSTLPWYPRYSQGRISIPERQNCEYTIRYPDHAIHDPKVNGNAKDETSAVARLSSIGLFASLQQSTRSDWLVPPRRKLLNPSELSKYAILKPGHGRLNPYLGAPDSRGEGKRKTTAGDVAPLVIWGLTVGFFVGVIFLQKRV